MSIRSNHVTRNIDSRKSSLPTVGSGVPSNKQGNEGDISFRVTSNGLKLYIKAKGSWHGVKVGNSFDSIEKSISDIKSRLSKIETFKLFNRYPVKGDYTLDASGDIELNADGGQVTIKDDTASHFLFDCDNTKFTMYDDANANDYFSIAITAEGATTISTVDADTDVAHLTLDADGDIYLDAVLANSGDVIGLKNAGTTFSAFQIHHSASWFYLYENGGASTTDFLSIKVEANGESTISTNDAAGTAAHLLLYADGNINIDSSTGSINFKDAGTTMTTISNDRLRVHNQTDTADYFNIQVGASGATTLSTVDDGAAVGHLILDPDGELQITPSGNMTLDCGLGNTFKSDNPVMIKEIPSAYTDSSTYGQIWVKNSSPNELYFTTGDGDDIQLTDGTSIAGGGGGSSKVMLASQSGRVNTNNTGRYYYGNTTYGWDYHAPSSYDTSPTGLSYLYTHGGVVVPFGLSKIGLNAAIRASSTNDFEAYAYIGTPSWGNTTATTLVERIALTKSSPTTNRFYNLSGTYTGSISANDIIVIFLRSSGGTQYLYYSYTLWGEAS